MKPRKWKMWATLTHSNGAPMDLWRSRKSADRFVTYPDMVIRVEVRELPKGKRP